MPERFLPVIVERVTRQHAMTFAEALIDRIYRTGAVFEAMERSGVMKWPDAYLDDHADQDKYRELESKILDKTFARVREAIAEAFLGAATEVLKREHGRRRRVC